MRKEKTKSMKIKSAKEITLPDNVEASVSSMVLSVKGPTGDVTKNFSQHRVELKVDGKKITLSSKSSTKKDKKIMGSLAAHIKNMIGGSIKKHVYTLKICSGHFPMNVSAAGNKFIVKNFLGEKVPRVLQLKEGADVKVEGELIHVESSNKETAGQVSADIEQLTRRPGYDTRIFQDGIYIINKDGRDLK